MDKRNTNDGFKKSKFTNKSNCENIAIIGEINIGK